MKSGTPDLLKFRRLQRRLGVSKVVLVGTLELLWMEVAKNTPQGDIGRFTNEDIATLCEWDGDADELVSALTEEGWFDDCPEHRLIVHDWEEHAPNYVKGNLARHGKTFAKQCAHRTLPGEVAKEATQGIVPPSQAKPSLAKPNQANVASGGDFELLPDDKPKKRKADTGRFQEFYDPYPNKSCRGDAEKAFGKLSAENQGKAIRASPKYRAWCQAMGRVGEPRPFQNPSKFLNSGTYLDVLDWEPEDFLEGVADGPV